MLHHAPFPRTSRSRSERALVDLHRQLGASRVLDQPEACARFGTDMSETPESIPDGVVLASCVEDVVETLRICERHEVPVTPRGAGSGKTGGSVPVHGGIVLALEGMAEVKEISREDQLVVCGPGVVTGRLQSLVEAEGLFYPPDPNSLEYCAIGGNVAENAGGPRAYKYGVTREYVLGVEAVLMGGTTIQAGRRTVKGVTGYDVVGTMVGSEGTLAVFTELTLRLVARPPRVVTLLSLFGDVRDAGAAVSSLVAAGQRPRCLELFDDGALEALRAAGAAIDPRARALLLIEVDGEDEVERDFVRVGELCTTAGAIEVQVAQDAAQRDRLWAARRELSPSIRRRARQKLSEDVVVPRSQLVALLEACRRIGEEERIHILTYGHAGDGNLHVNFLWNEDDEVPRVERAIERCFRQVVGLRGTLSGEHGIGVLKAPYLLLEQSQALVDLQLRLKSAFDPRGLLNPGKIFPGAGHRAC